MNTAPFSILRRHRDGSSVVLSHCESDRDASFEIHKERRNLKPGEYLDVEVLPGVWHCDRNLAEMRAEALIDTLSASEVRDLLLRLAGRLTHLAWSERSVDAVQRLANHRQMSRLQMVRERQWVSDLVTWPLSLRFARHMRTECPVATIASVVTKRDEEVLSLARITVWSAVASLVPVDLVGTAVMDRQRGEWIGIAKIIREMTGEVVS